METLNQEIKYFRSYPAQTYWKIVGSFFYVCSGCFIIWLFFRYGYQFDLAKMFQSDKGSLIILFIGFITLFISMLIVYYQVVLLWTGHYFVRIYENKVVGYNMWMRPKVVFYDDVIEIRPMRFVSGMLVLTNKGKTLRLISGIEQVGEAIEYIQKKSLNLKKIDFGRLKNAANFWKFESDWPKKYENVDVKIVTVIKYLVIVYGGVFLFFFLIIKAGRN